MNRSSHRLLGLVLFGVLATTSIARAQSVAPTATPPTSTVPRSVPFTAQVATPTGAMRTGSVMLTFGLYTDQKDGTPIWTEQQLVALDTDGRYAVILGSTSADGLPADAFAAGTPRWLGVQVEGEKEQPRFMLLSVPYALKAGDADTVAGKAATDFVLSSNLSDTVKTAIKESKTDPSAPFVTPNALVKYQNSGGALTESSTVDVGGKLGVQVAAPLGELDIAGLGSSTTITLRNGGSAADVVKLVGTDGSLRIGSATNANLVNLIGPYVGIGTTAPGAKLHINGAAEGVRIQGAAPGDANAAFMAFVDGQGTRIGYVGDGSSNDTSIILNSDAGDVALRTAAGRVLTVTPGGNVGIGTTTPVSAVHVSGSDAASTSLVVENLSSGGSPRVVLSNYGTAGAGLYWPGLDSANTSSLFGPNLLVLRAAAGLVLSGSSTAEHMRIFPDGRVTVGTTNTDPSRQMQVAGSIYGLRVTAPSGAIFGVSGQGSGVNGESFSNIGVYGSSFSSSGVYGSSVSNDGVTGHSQDAVGVRGRSTNSWAGYFEGDVHVTGTVSEGSDARLKQSIDPLRYGLREVLALRPVSWVWKEKPDLGRQLGLIAQEVEGVLPELVTTSKDSERMQGLKYVGLLPVIIKAIQEQQAATTASDIENAALKAQNAALEARVAAIEQALQQLAVQQRDVPTKTIPR